MDRIKRILSVSLAMVTSLTVFNGIPLPLQNNNSTALTAFAEDSAAKTYESIYGDWIYTEIETDNNIPNTDYADQTYLTDIVCHRYCLEDVNHDGIKELIVHYGMGGTDEQFFSYCMYQNGNTVWGETLTGIYLTNDCWLSADGDGLLTVSDFGSKTDQIDRFSYGKWMPEKLGGEHPHTCPGEAAGSDPAAPSYYSYGTFNIAGLADGEKPLAYPAEMMEHCGNKLIWYEPTDRTPLRETVPSVSDDSGTCGDNLTWTFDAATGTLTISGTGSRVKTTLSDFSAIYNKIKKIVLPNTVKEIGDHAFFSFSALEIISLPDGLRSIGEEAFRWCESLTEINIPESVTQIGGNAFENTQWLNNRRSENPFVIVNSILIDGNRVQGNVTIPDGVTSIAPLAFEKSQTVTGVTIPNGVSTIGASAFKECVNLTTVVIPESLQYIADAAFAFSGLKSIAIPDSVYSIGNSAFYYCNELSSVSLPQGLMWINAYTFKGCEGLTSIELPRTLIYIDTSAFSFSGIRQIHIPCRVDHIYEDAFNYCSALTDITIENPACEIVDSPGTISNGSSSAYTIYSFTGSTAEAYANKYNRNFVALPGDGACGKDLYWDYNAATKKLTIFGTGEMDNWVGQGQLSTQSPWPRTIKSVGLPDGLTNIGSDAFFSCDPTEITLPEGLEEINWRAFGFSKIESVTLPESLIKIWPQAFSNCEQLHAITIPENVNEIGAMAFSNCKNLESITFLNPGCRIEDEKGTIFNAYEENDYVFTGTIYGYTGSTAEAYAQKYNRKFVELDDTAIVSSGACGENGDHVKWTLDEEGTLMIFGSGNIKEWKAMIAAPKYSGGAIRKASDYSLSFTGESIPWYDLRENIKKIVVNSGVTSIPNYCFWGCTKAVEVHLADSVGSIGNSAFFNCSSLMEFVMPKNITVIENSTFDFCSALESVKLPSGITAIKAHAFDECKCLTDILLPDSITTIGTCAFYNCVNLESVSIPKQTSVIDSSAFAGCSKLANISISDGTKAIQGYAFSGCASLAEITIPESVISIDANAFSDCSALKRITILNPDCTIYDDSRTICNDRIDQAFTGTIYGRADSTAESYARKYNRRFVTLNELVKGDLNGDNSVTAADAQTVLGAYAEELAGNPHGLTDEQFAAADVDGNGSLSARDAQNILMYFLLNNILDEPTDWETLLAA